MTHRQSGSCTGIRGQGSGGCRFRSPGQLPDPRMSNAQAMVSRIGGATSAVRSCFIAPTALHRHGPRGRSQAGPAAELWGRETVTPESVNFTPPVLPPLSAMTPAFAVKPPGPPPARSRRGRVVLLARRWAQSSLWSRTSRRNTRRRLCRGAATTTSWQLSYRTLLRPALNT